MNVLVLQKYMYILTQIRKPEVIIQEGILHYIQLIF